MPIIIIIIMQLCNLLIYIDNLLYKYLPLIHLLTRYPHNIFICRYYDIKVIMLCINYNVYIICYVDTMLSTYYYIYILVDTY